MKLENELTRQDTSKVIVINTLLTILTLGIYSPWAKTNIRKYFWSTLTLNGKRFLYIGTGKELFIAYLKVGAIIAGITVVSKIVESTVSVGAAAAINALIFLPIYFLGFRFYLGAYRYRMNRTTYDGQRVHCDYSDQPNLYWRSVKWTLGVLFSGGLAMPYIWSLIDDIKFNSTSVGGVKFKSQSAGVDYYMPYFFLFGAYIAFAVITTLTITLLPGILPMEEFKTASEAGMLPLMLMKYATPFYFGMIGLFFLGGIALFSGIISTFNSLKHNARFKNLQLGPQTKVQSKITTWEYFKTTMKISLVNGGLLVSCLAIIGLCSSFVTQTPWVLGAIAFCLLVPTGYAMVGFNLNSFINLYTKSFEIDDTFKQIEFKGVSVLEGGQVAEGFSEGADIGFSEVI